MYLLLIATVLIFQSGSEAYKAAVYEHYPITGSTPKDTILKNLQEYRQKVQTAQDKGTDIIVFPEYGLTTVVRDPEEYAIDLSNDDMGVLVELKSIALEHVMYIVVNLLEKVKDSNSKTLYYNTNLVFNREGNITAKYRKINLYDEPKLTPGDETVTFKTDFGVTFGIFTCADILFNKPSQTVFEKDEKVTDVVFPSAWYSTLPFYSSLSVQHGYAISNGVNLLAANYGKPKEGHGGSGIYSGNGEVLELYIDSSPSSKLITQTVTELAKRQLRTSCGGIAPQGLPIPDQKSSIEDFVTFKNFDSSKYTFENVDVTQDRAFNRLCLNDFCCNFNITIKNGNSNEHYKLAVFDGWVSIDKIKDQQHIRFCSLVACESDSKESCGARINGTTRFAIRISAVSPSGNTTFYRPVTLNHDLRPIEDINYCSNNEAGGSTTVEVATRFPEKGVLAFGILGSSAVQNTGILGNSAVKNTGILALLIVAFAKLVVL